VECRNPKREAYQSRGVETVHSCPRKRAVSLSRRDLLQSGNTQEDTMLSMSGWRRFVGFLLLND
jgi:hypothetical protein